MVVPITERGCTPKLLLSINLILGKRGLKWRLLSSVIPHFYLCKVPSESPGVTVLSYPILCYCELTGPLRLFCPCIASHIVASVLIERMDEWNVLL